MTVTCPGICAYLHMHTQAHSRTPEILLHACLTPSKSSPTKHPISGPNSEGSPFTKKRNLANSRTLVLSIKNMTQRSLEPSILRTRGCFWRNLAPNLTNFINRQLFWELINVSVMGWGEGECSHISPAQHDLKWNLLERDKLTINELIEHFLHSKKKEKGWLMLNVDILKGCLIRLGIEALGSAIQVSWGWFMASDNKRRKRIMTAWRNGRNKASYEEVTSQGKGATWHLGELLLPRSST
jgi:hypothetical protein